MGIRFTCQHCEQRLNIKSDLAGKTGVCPHCRGRISIPLADTPSAAAIDASSDSQSSPGHVTATGDPQSAAPQPDTDQRAVATQAPAGAVATATPAGAADTAAAAGAAASPTATSTIQWYVRPPTGGQYGPASDAMMQAWIAENRVTAAALVWCEGWEQWRPAGEAFPRLAKAAVKSNDPFADVDGQGTYGGVSYPSSALSRQADRRDKRSQLVITLAGASFLLLLALTYMLLF